MGLEAICDATFGKRTSKGKAQLETDYIVFRGDFRLKVLFTDLKRVEAKNGTLRLQFEGGPATLQLGQAADKWAEKILRPPSRLQKLGIKPGLKVALVGHVEDLFASEMREHASRLESSDVAFLAVESTADLDKLTDVIERVPPPAALWIIYPKGRKDIRETDVIGQGRASGLIDIKVVSFSATHTGLKFVRLKSARPAKAASKH
jgi:hypothetical protein